MEEEEKVTEKKPGFWSEFRDFIMQGNVMDLAVGVIIGAAFQSIVNSLVNDIIMPVITLITGGIDFTNWFISLDGSHYSTLAAAQEAGAATLNYGVFITAVIQFIILALVIFLMIKVLSSITKGTKKLMHKEDVEPAPTTKVCPYCKSEIPIDATRCPCCTSQLEEAEKAVEGSTTES